MSVDAPEKRTRTPTAAETAGALDAARRELEQERHARQIAASEVERERGVARLLDRLSSVLLARGTLDDLLQKVVELAVELTRVDTAVLRLRDGDRLRSKAAVGVEEEVAAGFALPIAEGLPPAAPGDGERGPPSGTPVAATSSCGSEFIRRKGLRELHCVSLYDAEDLVGVLYLGVREGRQLSAEELQLLGLLAPRAAATIARHVDHAALRRGVRARDELLGTVAHDLRNPVTGIALTAHNLLRLLPDNSSRRLVDRIVRAATRCERLIQGLLEITAIEGGQFSMETRPVEAADTVLTALVSQQSLAADSSIILATDIAPDLPPLEADEERVLEVLENLIGNAVKFTSPGGTVTLGASARSSGREVLFRVTDSGCGIAPEELPHLFDRFWQAGKKDRRGSGLGLTICKAIVEAHGGKIWAETKLGEGTSLFFTIPATSPIRSKDASEPTNILIVDDRPENVLALKAILDRPDYRLVAAASGAEALGLALREQFSVALIDIAMPIMNGLEVAVHLKELERSRDIPIIFITAFGDDPQEIHRAYSAGGADYLVKPLNAEIVRRKVAVFADLSRRRREHSPTGERSSHV